MKMPCTEKDKSLKTLLLKYLFLTCFLRVLECLAEVIYEIL